jgi:hypothetical protein
MSIYRLNISESGLKTVTEQITNKHKQRTLFSGRDLTPDNWIDAKNAYLADRANGFKNMKNFAKWERDNPWDFATGPVEDKSKEQSLEESNAGYRIIQRESVLDSTWVVGENLNAVSPYVVWIQNDRGYDAGIYFQTQAGAEVKLYDNIARQAFRLREKAEQTSLAEQEEMSRIDTRVPFDSVLRQAEKDKQQSNHKTVESSISDNEIEM